MTSPTAERVSFRELVRSDSRPYTLEDDQDANLVGMRWYGEGPFHRELKPALQIAKKSHFVIRAGDVIYNKLFAWKGSFGIVPPELDGMYVSDKFPTYELDRSRTDEEYLKWFFRHPDVWEQARLMSTGSAALSKLTLNPPQFLDLEIPLPSLADQRYIATRIGELASKIEEARKTRESASKELAALRHVNITACMKSLNADAQLNDVLTAAPRNGWSPNCDNLESGTSVLTLSAVTGWNYNPSAFKRTSQPINPDAHYWAVEGDLLITRSNTPELVGHAAIYNGSPNPCIYPDLMMRVPIDPRKASTRFVWYWLQSARARDFIRRSAKGTSPTMKKISQPIVQQVPFPANLTLDVQEDIARRLDAIRASTNSVAEIQAETSNELKAMLPAILDKAFKGELV
jgi:type I restriction enzyme S subunit